MSTIALTIADLRGHYLAGRVNVLEVIEEVLRRVESVDHPHVWIYRLSRQDLLGYAARLTPDRMKDLPLYGIPFAIKDNIDLAQVPTTCACPDFAYVPRRSATVVERLIAAGAIPIGKTNLDQFATGLVGVRTPYGACRSVFNPEYISGGSSSGSAVAVASGMVSFSLGTDTAGSGRVPAAFNNIVGLKPSKGILSTKGVFPACRSLDCVSIFAGSCFDAELVFSLAAAKDKEDAYSRSLQDRGLPSSVRFGVPKPGQLEFFGDAEAADLYQKSIKHLQGLGHLSVEIDFAPFAKTAALLYAGPWVAERQWAIGKFLTEKSEAMDPIVRSIVEQANKYQAIDAFHSAYQLQEYASFVETEWEKMDVLLLPTTGTTYSLKEIAAEPIKLNTNLGYYTNFVNLLDLSAVAVPGGFRSSNGLPFGVTLMAQAFRDRALLVLGDQLHRSVGGKLGKTAALLEEQPNLPGSIRGEIRVAVVGAHLSGEPLNHQLTSRNGRLVATTRTAPNYRFYRLANTQPAKPGLVKVPEKLEQGIEVEVWSLSKEAFGDFVNEVPPPMAIGTIQLEDQSSVKGFICEPSALENAIEITSMGGWRAFLKTQNGKAKVP